MNIESRWQKVQWKKLLKNRHRIEWRVKRLLKRKKNLRQDVENAKGKYQRDEKIPPLFFALSDQTLSTSEIPIRSLNSASSTSFAISQGRSLSDLPPHSQAPTPPLRNPLHSLSSTLRACSQSTSTATHQNRLYAGHDRNRTASHPSAVFRWPPSCLACCFPAKVAFPLSREARWKK